ncbi:MAG: hypothetical protein SO401_00420 [Blautia sp.]|nr:hypothetical protein [Blautia sp.]
MQQSTKLSTCEILEQFNQNLEVKEEDIDFINKKELRNELSVRILESFRSMTKFAEACGIQVSHLNDFLNDKKGFRRNRMLIVCITLKMSIQETQDALKYFEHPPLHPKNKRDYLILNGIRQKLSWQEIDSILTDNGYKSLTARE